MMKRLFAAVGLGSLLVSVQPAFAVGMGELKLAEARHEQEAKKTDKQIADLAKDPKVVRDAERHMIKENLRDQRTKLGPSSKAEHRAANERMREFERRQKALQEFLEYNEHREREIHLPENNFTAPRAIRNCALPPPTRHAYTTRRR